MKQLTRLLISVALVMVIGASPAFAGTSGGLEAAFEEGHGIAPNYDPAALVARGCPAESGWIFGGEGTGHLTSTLTGAASTPFDYRFDYCSRFVAFDAERTTGRFVGKAQAGEMIITVDAENMIYVAFEGTWTFNGVLAPPDFTADLHLRYTVTGGTGIFDGATGHGRLSLANTVDLLGGVDTLQGALTGSVHVK